MPMKQRSQPGCSAAEPRDSNPEAWDMRRGLMIAGVVGARSGAACLGVASDGIPASAFYPHIGVSLIGLAVAAMLLVQALGVRKIALGGAIAEKMSYVILAILCLAARP